MFMPIQVQVQIAITIIQIPMLIRPIYSIIFLKSMMFSTDYNNVHFKIDYLLILNKSGNVSLFNFYKFYVKVNWR